MGFYLFLKMEWVLFTNICDEYNTDSFKILFANSLEHYDENQLIIDSLYTDFYNIWDYKYHTDSFWIIFDYSSEYNYTERLKHYYEKQSCADSVYIYLYNILEYEYQEGIESLSIVYLQPDYGFGLGFEFIVISIL